MSTCKEAEPPAVAEAPCELPPRDRLAELRCANATSTMAKTRSARAMFIRSVALKMRLYDEEMRSNDDPLQRNSRLLYSLSPSRRASTSGWR